MGDTKMFTQGIKTADTCVQSVFVDGCKVTLHYNQKSNSTVLREIKSILAAALLPSDKDENLQK